MTIPIAIPIIVGLLGAVAKGIGDAIETGKIRKQQKDQAKRIQDNIDMLRKQAESREIDANEALARIDTMVANTSGELKKITEDQLSYATRDINDALKKATEQVSKEAGKARETIRQTMVQRRLGGSEAEMASQGKMAQQTQEQQAKMTEAAQKQISGTREQALSALAQKLLGLKTSAAAQKEGVIAEGKEAGYSLQNQRAELQNYLSTLGNLGSDMDAFLAGALGRTGTLAGQTASQLIYDLSGIASPTGKTSEEGMLTAGYSYPTETGLGGNPVLYPKLR